MKQDSAFKRKELLDLPVAQALRLRVPLQGLQVRSLVRELTSMHHAALKKKKEKKELLTHVTTGVNLEGTKLS